MDLTATNYSRSRLPDPVSVEAALSSRSGDIRVPAGTELTVGPFSGYADTFKLARVETFADIQKLGFVPEHITEEGAVNALRNDDKLYRDARRNLDMDHCSCSDHYSGSTSDRPTALRRHYQDHLLELLLPLQRRSLLAADTDIVHIYRQIQRWASRPAVYLVGLVSISDIEISEKATLFMTHTVTSLYARNINMGANSRLRFHSGNVHVRCETLNGPNRLVSDRANLERYVYGLSRELAGRVS